MNSGHANPVFATSYDQSTCQTGVVHLGCGAFHLSHQAINQDDYMHMKASGDLCWGVAAEILHESAVFKDTEQDNQQHNEYFLKAISMDPTLESCLLHNIILIYSIRSIASWYLFVLHVDAEKIEFDHIDPGWSEL